MNGYLIDMDGVIYHGSQLIPGAAKFIRHLQSTSTPFLFLTNNSERSPKDLATKLAHLGLRVSWRNFYTAAHCTADFLVRQRAHSSAYVIGDTMETDVKGALEIGMRAYLVLTGSTKREDLARYAYSPTRVFSSIAEVLEDAMAATRGRKLEVAC